MLEENSACRTKPPLTIVILEQKKKPQRATNLASALASCSHGMPPLSLFLDSTEARQKSKKMLSNVPLTVTTSFRAPLPVQVMLSCVLLSSQLSKEKLNCLAPVLITTPPKL